jgi:hypothetical protein
MKGKEIVKFSPDTIKDLEKTDLVQLSRNLLGAVVDSTNAMDNTVEMNPKRLQEMRLVLSYLNATVNATKAKMQFFKMVGVGDKVNAVRRTTKTKLK